MLPAAVLAAGVSFAAVGWLLANPNLTMAFRPLRIDKIEKELLGKDVRIEIEYYAEPQAGQVWSRSDTRNTWFVVREDGTWFTATSNALWSSSGVDRGEPSRPSTSMSSLRSMV